VNSPFLTIFDIKRSSFARCGISEDKMGANDYPSCFSNNKIGAKTVFSGL
jgi:hypothetical protein